MLTTSRTTYTHIDSLCRISTKQARGVKAFATEARPAAAATRPRWVARLACCSIGFSTGYLDRSAIRALRRTRRHCTVATLATFFVKISLKRLIKWKWSMTARRLYLSYLYFLYFYELWYTIQFFYELHNILKNLEFHRFFYLSYVFLETFEIPYIWNQG